MINSQSSQVITLPIAKSQTRIKTKTCTAAVCIAGRKAPPNFNIGRRMSRCPRSKNATRVPPSLCNVTQTSDPADPPYEHVECAARVCVARDLVNSSGQAQYGHDRWPVRPTRSRRSTHVVHDTAPIPGIIIPGARGMDLHHRSSCQRVVEGVVHLLYSEVQVNHRPARRCGAAGCPGG